MPDEAPATKLFIDVHGERGRIGKTFISNRIRDYLESSNSFGPIDVVRIESKAARPIAREKDVRIYLEDLSDARGEIGGSAAGLTSLWQTLEQTGDNGVVILDWPAGTSDLRFTTLASTQMMARCARRGFRCISVVVSTVDATVLEQAAEAVEKTDRAAPSAEQVAVLNEISGGHVARIPAASEQHKAHNRLVSVMDGRPILTFPAIPKRSWELFEYNGLEAQEVLQADIEELAPRVQRDEFVVEACRLYLAGWWQTTDREIRKFLAYA